MSYESIKYAYSDGKDFHRTGSTFFQPREKYKHGTAEGIAFWNGVKIAKFEDAKAAQAATTQDNEKAR